MPCGIGSPADVREVAKKAGLSLPILLNPHGEVADLFGVTVTTTTVVIDGKGVIRYFGRFSDGGSQHYAEDALRSVLADKEVAIKSTTPDGCAIIRE